MSGTLLSLLEMTSYDFDDIGDDGEVAQLVASNVDVSRWPHGELLVRVHSHTIGTGAGLAVEVRRALPSPQDPSRRFEQDAIASAPLTSSTTAPSLIVDALTEPLGSYVNVYVIAAQPANNTTLSATISVELVLKS